MPNSIHKPREYDLDERQDLWVTEDFFCIVGAVVFSTSIQF